MDNVLLLAALSPIFFLVILTAFYFTRVKKVGPNQAIIVYGRGDLENRRSTDTHIFSRIVIGGRTFVWPIVEGAQILSLEPARANFKLDKILTSDGQRVTLTGKMQYKVPADHRAAMKAAMHFLSKTEAERTTLVMDLVEDTMRRVVEESSREEIEQSPMKFGDMVIEAGRPKLAEMGVEVLSLIIEEVS